MCNGQQCTDNCDPCTSCNSSSCQIASNCYCPSTNIPTNMALDNVPQFVFLSIRGGVKQNFIEQTNFTTRLVQNASILDSRGCPVKPSLYVTTDVSDYNVVNYFQNVGTLGFQSVSNKITPESTDVQMNAEFSKGLEFLNKYGKIDPNSIKLVRNPSLQLADNYYNVLKKYNFTIDSSVYDDPSLRNTTERLWPYTLDFGLPTQNICTKYCPTETFPGLWEFPIPKLINLNNINQTYTMYDLQMGNYTDSVNLVMDNFYDNYLKSRAPFGLVLDIEWFYLNAEEVDQRKMEFIGEVYQLMSLETNVLFATEEEIIDWVKNPKAILIAKQSFTCRAPFTLEDACGGMTPLFCDYPNDRSSVELCITPNNSNNPNASCPEEYPNIRAEVCGDKVCTLGLDTCECSDCGGVCVPNWPGNATFEPYYETSTYVCGEIIYNNPVNEEAMNFVITAKIYWGKLDKVIGARTVEFSNNTLDCITETWRIKPYLLSVFYPLTNYSGIQLCVNKSKTEFDNDFVRLGIEIIQPLLGVNATLIEIDTQCGNSVCQAQERQADTCNCDCKIPFSALLQINLIFESIIFAMALLMMILWT